MESISFKLRPHQQEALKKLKNGSILTGGVGSGKSLVAASYHVKKHALRDVIVITTAKKRDSLDWNREFARVGVTTEPTSLFGALTVDSWNNIHKYEDVKDAFFIFDEQRLVGSGGWVKSFLRIARSGNSWILLSATPGDNWLDYIPVFIANGFYKNRTEFKAQHVVYKSYTKFPSVERYLGVGKLVRLRNAILVQMPFERHTRRNTHIVPVEFDDVLMKMARKMWNPFEERPIERAAEQSLVMRKIVSIHPSRLEALKKIMEKHPRVIVFYNFDYELEILRGVEGIEIREWNGHKHEEIPDSERWLYLVQYTAGAEGWECIETDATIFWSQNPSYKQTEQAYGRIDRMNTPFIDLHYYLLLSNSFIDKRMRRAFNEKRDFNLSDLSSSL